MPSQTEMQKPATPAPTPTAWMGWIPGAGSVNSYHEFTRHKSVMERWGSEVEVTPLYTIEALKGVHENKDQDPIIVTADGRLSVTSRLMQLSNTIADVATSDVFRLEQELNALRKEHAKLRAEYDAVLTMRTYEPSMSWFQEVLTDIDEKYGIIRGSKEGCAAIRADLQKLKQIYTLQQSLFGAVIRPNVNREEDSHD